MKLRFILSAILIAATTAVFAQDDNNWESKKYNMGEFTKISLEGGFRVYLVQDDECSITVKATNSDVFDNIKIGNYRGEVSVKMEMSFFEYRRVNLYISFKTLEKLTIEGGVNLKTNGYLDLSNFAAHLEGGANVELDVKAKDIEVYGEGGFLFELKGVADRMDVTIKGAGHVSARELKTKDVNFTVSGFGTGTVFATNKLNARIEGVGRLRYKGDPKVEQYIDGLGSVKHE